MIFFNKKLIGYIYLYIILSLLYTTNIYTYNKKNNQANITKSVVFSKHGINFFFFNKKVKSVYLKTSINQWRSKFKFIKKINASGHWNGMWFLLLPLNYKNLNLIIGKNNSFLYLFEVDGQYIHDPLNPNTKDNMMGGKVSCFNISKEESKIISFFNVKHTPIIINSSNNRVSIKFIYKNISAKKVDIAGDFNNWESSSFPLENDGNGNWSIVLTLPPGRYYYNFIINGKNWIHDPLNSNKIQPISKINKMISYFDIK